MKQSILPRISSLVAALAAVTLICVSLQPAEARPRPRSSKFSANKEFGLGIMIGAPTGLAGKYYLSADTALDFGVGYIDRWGARHGFHLHADFLWHPAVLINARPFVVPFYFGVGGRLFDYDADNDDDLAAGLRVPFGIMFDFNNVPLDIFFELVFVFDVLERGGGRDYLNGAIGFRYYF